MKKSYLIGGLLVLVQILGAQDLTQKKAELQRQMKEIEAEEKRQKELEAQKVLENLGLAQKEEQPQNGEITQAVLDAEAKKLFGKNRNGVLIGIGYGGMDVKYKGAIVGNKDSLYASSARLGYQRFGDNKVLGGRIYLDSHLGINSTQSPQIRTTIQSITALNFDALMDFRIPNTYHYFGLFVGVGLGVLDFHHRTEPGLLALGEEILVKGRLSFANFGLAWTGGAKHRFELYFKKPLTETKDKLPHWKTPIIFNVAYQFTF